MIRLSTTFVPEPVIIIGGGTGMNDLSRNSIQYVPMFDTGLSATESDFQQSMPVAGTLSHFYVTLDGSPGGGSYTFVVRKKGANTLVTSAISGTATTGSDLINSVSFSAGDYISIMVTPASMPTARSMRWAASR